MQQRDSPRRHQWRLFGRFGGDSVAGGQCRRDLTHENRQWEIPWRDRREHATPTQGPGVPLAGWSRQLTRRRKVAAGMQRVPAAMIRRFTQFGDAIRQDLTALARQQEQKLLARRLDQVRGTLQHRSTVRSARGIPVTPAARQLVDRCADLARRRIIDCTDQNATIGGTTDLPPAPGGTISRAMDRRQQRRRCRAIGQIDARRIHPIWIQVARRRDAWISAATTRCSFSTGSAMI